MIFFIPQTHHDTIVNWYRDSKHDCCENCINMKIVELKPVDNREVFGVLSIGLSYVFTMWS